MANINVDLYNEFVTQIADAYHTTDIAVENTLSDWGISYGDYAGASKLLEGTSYEFLENVGGSLRTFNVKNSAYLPSTTQSSVGSVNSNVTGNTYIIDTPVDVRTQTATDIVKFESVVNTTGNASGSSGISFGTVAGWVGSIASLVMTGLQITKALTPDIYNNVTTKLKDTFPEPYEGFWHDFFIGSNPLDSVYSKPGITTNEIFEFDHPDTGIHYSLRAPVLNSTKNITDDDGNVTGYEYHKYIDEDTFAYYVKWLNDVWGIYKASGIRTVETTVDGTTIPSGMYVGSVDNTLSTITNLSYGGYVNYDFKPLFTFCTFSYSNGANGTMYWGERQTSGNEFSEYKASTQTTIVRSGSYDYYIVASVDPLADATTPFGFSVITNEITGATSSSWIKGRGNSSSLIYDSQLVYYQYYIIDTSSYQSVSNTLPVVENSDLGDTSDAWAARDELVGKIAWTLLYGDTTGTGSTITYPDGIEKDTTATQFTLDESASSPESVKNALKEQIPSLWDNSITQTIAQSDGTEKTYTYIEMPIPSVSVDAETDTETSVSFDNQTQSNTGLSSDTVTEHQTESVINENAKESTATTTSQTGSTKTGEGSSPSVIPPSGDSTALYAIYNPSKSQIDEFGAWLWSADFVDQILKLFSDPMQAIIGLHKVYCTPSDNNGTQNIKVGYLDSGVASKTVKDQYTTIDCGIVNVRERFNNVFDYAPYTKIQLYLPFVGFVPLNVGEVMRSTLRVKYTVDVLTGACLAEVVVTRDGGGGTIYQYGGNAAVQVPISSGSYMGIVTSLASVAGSVAATVASGGAAAPVLLGSVGAVAGAHTNVEHSGGFTGNIGAMAGKIPYLIITRPQTAIANNQSEYLGIPGNNNIMIGNCTGFVRMKEVHLESIPASKGELDEIETLLKSGVLI